MQTDIGILVATAASIGLIHTLAGPDHYVPFVAMARARGWSRARTLMITAACGVAHVGSSVVLGLIGIAFGVALGHLTWLETVRGEIAAWLLISFGIVYCVWGIRRALRNAPHTHRHVHEDGGHHEHPHGHDTAHAHVHDATAEPSLTPWILFTIFVFGPCEPLIPILMYPAVRHSTGGLALVTLAFGVVTIATMLVTVHLGLAGARMLKMGLFERYSHALAGLTIGLTGLAIKFLGL